jgi:hypothetical protein
MFWQRRNSFVCSVCECSLSLGNPLHETEWLLWGPSKQDTALPSRCKVAERLTFMKWCSGDWRLS